MAFASACCVLFAQCSDFLETSSPSNTDDEFVTSSPAETLKTLSRAYALYRESCNGAISQLYKLLYYRLTNYHLDLDDR